MTASLDRRQVLGFRVRAQQLDREHGTLADTAVLDLGVQDTGPEGARWALALRGVDTSGATDHLVWLWTLRGAPHVYRRADLPGIAAAVAPWSDADAGKRIFDAAKPLKQAGIGNLEALDVVAATMRSVVTRPTVKGDVSGRVAELLDEPYLRFCRACDAVHLYEQPFRLAAVRAGLELEPGTSPPVLRRIKGFRTARTVPAALDVIRGYLRLCGPATPKQVSEYVDAPVKDVKEHWPDDAVRVRVDSEQRWVIADDEAALSAGAVPGVRLLGPYDLFLQARDRDLLVPDPDGARSMWPALGRPGGVLVDGDLVGSWRARKAGKRLTVTLQPWRRLSSPERAAVEEQAERLAAHRDARLAEVDLDG